MDNYRSSSSSSSNSNGLLSAAAKRATRSHRRDLQKHQHRLIELARRRRTTYSSTIVPTPTDQLNNNENESIYASPDDNKREPNNNRSHKLVYSTEDDEDYASVIYGCMSSVDLNNATAGSSSLPPSPVARGDCEEQLLKTGVQQHIVPVDHMNATSTLDTSKSIPSAPGITGYQPSPAITSVSPINKMCSTLSSEGSSGGGARLSPPRHRDLTLAMATTCCNTSDDDSGCALLEEYAWVPNGLKPRMIHRYFSCLPDDKVPYVNSTGEKWRVRQLLLQLPPQDTDQRYCQALSDAESSELRRFAAQRKQSSLGRAVVGVLNDDRDGQKCAQCNLPLHSGEVYVTGTRIQPSIYHCACFTCTTCSELLVDLIYFHHDDTHKIYCGRHHAELLKPRCAGCDEIIFSDECTEAEDRNWHMTHFACVECRQQLGGQRYVMKEQKPYCVQCYHTHCADRCSGCACAISVDQAHVTYGTRQWHANTDCFACSACAAPLLGRPFLPRHTGIYCSVDCCRVPTHEHKRPLMTLSPMSPSMPGSPPADTPSSVRMVQPNLSAAWPSAHNRNQEGDVSDSDTSELLQVLRLSASVENIYESVPTVSATAAPVPKQSAASSRMTTSCQLTSQNMVRQRSVPPSQRCRTGRPSGTGAGDAHNAHTYASAQPPPSALRHNHRHTPSKSVTSPVHTPQSSPAVNSSSASSSTTSTGPGGTRSYTKAISGEKVETTFSADVRTEKLPSSVASHSKTRKHVRINTDKNVFVDSPARTTPAQNGVPAIHLHNDDGACSTCSSDSDSSDDEYGDFLTSYITKQRPPPAVAEQPNVARAAKDGGVPKHLKVTDRRPPTATTEQPTYTITARKARKHGQSNNNNNCIVS